VPAEITSKENKNIFTKKKEIPISFYLFAMRYNHNDKIENFNSFMSNIENKFNSDIDELSKRYESYVKNLSQHECINEIDDDFGEQYSEIVYQVNNIFRRSLVVSIHSYLESTLGDLTKKILSKKGIKPSKKPPKISTLKHYKDTLENKANVDFSPISKEWDFINNANTIRNAIVHNNGSASSKIEQIEKITTGISINDRGIVIEKDYLTELLSCVDNFLLHSMNETLK
jgi:hypothetical protein